MFVKFCVGEGFRLVVFSVLPNHVHFVVEADSKEQLSMGMQKLLHSISRRLSAVSVDKAGGKIRSRDGTQTGGYSAVVGWLGKVFIERYYSHQLKTPTEIANAIRYVLQNAEHHGLVAPGEIDEYTSLHETRYGDHVVVPAMGFLLSREYRLYLQRRSG